MISPFGSPETTYLGTVFVVFGYLLAVHGWTFLLAGYSDDGAVPADEVADTVGQFALLLGVATIGFGALATRNSYSFGWQGIAFGAVVVLSTIGLTYRLHTDEATEQTTPTDKSVDLSTSSIEPDTQVPAQRSTAHSVDIQQSVPKVSGYTVDNPMEGSVQLSTTAVGQGVRTPREIPRDQQTEERSHQPIEGLTEASD